MLFRVQNTFVVALIVTAGLILSGPTSARAGDRIDFDRDIRPILSDKCFSCHGPDTASVQSGLQLNRRELAIKPAESGEPAIVPDHPEASTLIKRIFSEDPAEVMPPADSNRQLTAAQKDLLKQWIAQGAPYAGHWSFVAPVRPDVPKVEADQWSRNALDRFVLKELKAKGWAPNPEASRETLIRRVTFDLTGLPPTLQEVDEFLADTRADAYERLVNRLLDRPQFGERMALDWLDASRYADTHGYHIDSGRDMTHWRDYVIKAFNHNMPFDRFVVEQIAGDLLPDATIDQKIASGFNRNHMINYEGGAIPEEYHTAYIMDRVNTFGTVFLGLTVACAQCHDHKYDPISQREYYSLYAFFHNVPENGLDGRFGNAAPVLRLPTPELQQAIEALEKEKAALDQRLTVDDAALDQAQKDWEARSKSETPDWTVLNQGSAPTAVLTSKNGSTITAEADGVWTITGTNPDRDVHSVTFTPGSDAVSLIRLEVLRDESLNGNGPGRSVNGNLVLTRIQVRQKSEAGEVTLPLAGAAADWSQNDFPPAGVLDDSRETGWAILPQSGKSHWIGVKLDKPVEAGSGPVTVDFEYQSRFAAHIAGRIRVSTAPTGTLNTLESLTPELQQIVRKEPADRSDNERLTLRKFYRADVHPSGKEISANRKRLDNEIKELDKKIPTAMVMVEMEKPRDTFVLVRGEYDKKGEKVTAVTPAVLPPLPEGAANNRLGLARWLVSTEQPLMSRVIVNRYWQMFFGQGLVKTSEDFGAQGERPTHPELLDWLACEFRDGSTTTPSVGAWDIKELVRLMVTSSTYRQSSGMTPQQVADDPENQWLGRGPRFRLQAEFIRDQALALSQLLNPKIGGESVSPYQPAGLWEELMSRTDGDQFTAQKYELSSGPDLYRRTMYTFWKRTCPPPTLVTFDAPDREVCTVRRARTNTPLQALILLNDPTYVEAARKLAERIVREGGPLTEGRLEYLFRLSTARQITPRERAILKKLFLDQREVFREDPAAAKQLLSVGASSFDETMVSSEELAAWAIVASTILNLDEVVTRN